MKIGILSDTHNSIDITRRALSIFKEQGVEMIIHAGDITSPRMLKLFSDFKCRFVLGNGDIDVEDLNAESERLGFGCIGDSCTLELQGKKFLVFHGNDVPVFRNAVASGEYDYIIKGHTHFYENYSSGKSRVINPGCLYSGEDCSVVILDLDSDRVEMIRLGED